MCIILDANQFSRFFNSNHPNHPDMKPLRKILKKRKVKIAYAPIEKIIKEWKPNRNNEYFKELWSNGSIERYGKQEVTTAQQELSRQNKLKSDDPHLIALAQISGSNLLVSADQNLHKDFRNTALIQDGMIYQTKAHAHLLKKATCLKPS